MTPKEIAHEPFRVQGSSLRSVSKKRQDAAKKAGLTIASTFVPREGKTRLQQAQTFRRRSKPWKSSPAKRFEWTTKARTKLRQVGERARRVAGADSEWRRAVRAVWGTCLLTGAEEGLQAHHAYPKQAHPDKRHAVWNGILLCGTAHNRIHDTTGGMDAGQRLADEMRAAANGTRPALSRNEARQILFDHCQKLRQYARPE